MTWIIQHADDIMAIIFGLILVAEIVVNLTPSERDNSVLLKIKAIISALFPNRVKRRFPVLPDETEEFETTSRIVRRRKQKQTPKK